jgi:hypothetical protein
MTQMSHQNSASYRWEGNVKMDLAEIDHEGVDWVHVSRLNTGPVDEIQWWTSNNGNISIIRATVNFSKQTSRPGSDLSAP